MCGIVGYLGKDDAKAFILDGLFKLEYRGYDSAGISLYNEEKQRFDIYKDKGRVKHLESLLEAVSPSRVGIGHTRWATHGKVNQLNAHPHFSVSERFIVVHNGVIENYRNLRRVYLDGWSFNSETDTEVIVQLIEHFAENNTAEEAVLKTLGLLKGSYALLVIDQENPERLIAAKNKSPLLLGKGKNGVIVASDLMALAKSCDEYMPLEDYTMAVINADIKLYDAAFEPLEIQFEAMDFDDNLAELGEYPHFMLKEIMEQPLVMRKIVNHYFKDDTIAIDAGILKAIKEADRIYVLAAGTSMNAGFVSKTFFETLAHKPVEVHIASEFAYNRPLLTEKPVFILISQSGETADLRACLMNLKASNYETITVTNVRTSTLAREASHYLQIYAGPEIAVASTKAYTAQLAVLIILAYALSDKTMNLRKELAHLAHAMEAFLVDHEMLYPLTQKLLTKTNCFYIGRGVDYTLAIEAALKLKEVSYVQAEGFAAGELKHGTIALIEEGTPVIALISDAFIAANTRSNLEEVEARGAHTMVITTTKLSVQGDGVVVMDTHPLLQALLMILPTQLIAYYAALERGLDIDKPRNLAKSVTVE